MSQQPSTMVPPKTAPTHSLHPALQATLNSLDVDLEEELNRYRRQKAGAPAPPPKGLRRNHPPKTLNLISVTATVTSVPPVPEPVTHPPLIEPATPVEPPQSVSLTVPVPGQLEPDHSVPVPDDYLESSEALLKSLAESEELPPRSWGWETLRTPLGVGSILLLLMVSATFGLLLRNPTWVSELYTQLAQKNPESVPTPQAAPSPTAAVPPVTNLAKPEFVDLNLRTLATLKSAPAGNPTAPGVAVPPPPGSSESFYFVVVKDSSDRTLAQVKAVAPDAFIRPFPQGDYIQLALFLDAPSAERYAQNLQSQGILAQVYQPQP